MRVRALDAGIEYSVSVAKGDGRQAADAEEHQAETLPPSTRETVSSARATITSKLLKLQTMRTGSSAHHCTTPSSTTRASRLRWSWLWALVLVRGRL